MPNDLHFRPHTSKPSEATYRLMLESITECAIYMMDMDGTVLSWNAGSERIKGYSAREVLGQSFARFYTGHDRRIDTPNDNLKTAKCTGRCKCEGWRIRRDGTKFWAHVVIDALSDESGNAFAFIATTRDCTAQRKAGHSSHEEEHRFRFLVQSVTDYAIYMLDRTGNVSNWNEGARRFKGYQTEEIVGRHFSCFYGSEERMRRVPETALATALSEGKFETEGWRLRKDGSRFWAHVVIHPVFDDDGVHVGFAKVTQDCTEKRRAALALQATTQNLDLALSNMQQGLCLFDRFARLVLFNDQLASKLDIDTAFFMKGQRIPDLLRKLCTALFPHIANPAEAAKKFRRSLNVGKMQDDCYSTEFNLGSRRMALISRRLSQGGWVSTLDDVTDRFALQQRTEFLAHNDILTGLPNRVVFHRELRNVLADSSRAGSSALLYLDLDGFKTVNDTHGHRIGDQLLAAAGARLRTNLRGENLVARLGGDEFAIIASNCRNLSDAENLAARCIKLLTQPFHLHGMDMCIGASIGVAFQLSAGADTDEVLQRADFAMYQAKREGRNRYVVYRHGMRDPLNATAQLELDLRRALNEGQFELHYQPVVGADTGFVKAKEALLRWAHPDRGSIAPDSFIAIAERAGLMKEIGAWVLHRACMDARNWPEHIRVCVNVSPAQLNSVEFIEVIDHALWDSGIPPRRLEIEITETALFESQEHAHKLLEAVRNRGIGIALDDFGTGFSSLRLLQDFPFTRIKIDRSFVSRLGSHAKSLAIVRSIIGLCNSLEIPVTAEGVESADQRDYLHTLGCEELQGFFFGAAVPARPVDGGDPAPDESIWRI
ncbi:EAL domain-containing protein (plasmid) [Paraburkholderia sp. D15]|uniref:sensor domain-containing protein n=1 Tax=Paraburkholderia sp. D15 TaxID=2880218 RepID=UPI00247AB1A7|nr:EAL domain-containing protein [Paraburkholderia sp. D15]WGS55256.1 EAL domain-containing protein [Paraburkholderia sp. D15]